jgi:hypothetical protein
VGAETHGKATLGLLMRSLPYERRSAREQMDIALTAAALEIPLRLYFQGGSVLQLIKERDTLPARLPPGYRSWGSLTDLTAVCAHAEPEWLEIVLQSGLATEFDLRPMRLQVMREDLASCTRVLVL